MASRNAVMDGTSGLTGLPFHTTLDEELKKSGTSWEGVSKIHQIM
jgi:hypothetical protein